MSQRTDSCGVVHLPFNCGLLRHWEHWDLRFAQPMNVVQMAEVVASPPQFSWELWLLCPLQHMSSYPSVPTLPKHIQKRRRQQTHTLLLEARSLRQKWPGSGQEPGGRWRKKAFAPHRKVPPPPPASPKPQELPLEVSCQSVLQPKSQKAGQKAWYPLNQCFHITHFQNTAEGFRVWIQTH